MPSQESRCKEARRNRRCHRRIHAGLTNPAPVSHRRSVGADDGRRPGTRYLGDEVVDDVGAVGGFLEVGGGLQARRQLARAAATTAETLTLEHYLSDDLLEAISADNQVVM